MGKKIRQCREKKPVSRRRTGRFLKRQVQHSIAREKKQEVF